jgi:diguanylate cyclase (GGDEF)-like protein
VWQGEAWNCHKSGRLNPCLLSLVRIEGTKGSSGNSIGFFKDLTEVLAAKQRIEELAYSDALTGLPNRTLLAERFDAVLEQARRTHQGFAVLFLDLDRFKQINDSLGHVFGDRVLVKVAKRLKCCLRQTDTVARLGGDEFVLLLDQSDARGAESTARRLLAHLAQPVTFDDLAFTLTCSIGIALYPDDGTSMDDLIKNADSAMYSAKERGRSDFRFYERQMNVGLLSRMKLDHAIRQALEHGEFRLKFQPQAELRSGRVFGAEALLRWRDPELGEIAPGQFIPIAEENGAIVPIGDWVLDNAVRQAASWYRRGLDLVTSINVSPLQFQQSGFVDSVERALRDASLPPALLELELTESVLIRDVQDTLAKLQVLAEIGVVLVVDDFGTGYSSLGYLKRFPIRKLKIDRSFVEHLPASDSDAAIVRAIIELGHALNLRVIAEGVETSAQQQALLAAGCDDMQGFLCAPPLDFQQLEQFVRQSGAGQWTKKPAA